MNELQKNVVKNTLNIVSLEPLNNMQQLVSHWATVIVPETSSKKRGRTIEQSLVSEPPNNQTKRRILTRP